jgi:hypothetical protein
MQMEYSYVYVSDVALEIVTHACKAWRNNSRLSELFEIS